MHSDWQLLLVLIHCIMWSIPLANMLRAPKFGFEAEWRSSNTLFPLCDYRTKPRNEYMPHANSYQSTPHHPRTQRTHALTYSIRPNLVVVVLVAQTRESYLSTWIHFFRRREGCMRMYFGNNKAVQPFIIHWDARAERRCCGAVDPAGTRGQRQIGVYKTQIYIHSIKYCSM